MPRIDVNTNADATTMAETIFGDDIQVVGATYTGNARASGTFSDGEDDAPGFVPSDSGVILSTGRADRVSQRNGDYNQSNSQTTSSAQGNSDNAVDNDSAFNALVGTNTYDAAFLDVDIIPTGDFLTLQFVLSSEEYPEYINSTFNDTFAVWVNGAVADVSVGSGNASINTVNSETAENLFIDNTNDTYNTEMDGFTVTLSLTVAVDAGEVNSIRFGVADATDSSYDTNVLIAAESGQSVVVAMDDNGTAYIDGTTILDITANDINLNGPTLTVTQINGQNVVAGQTITLPSGQDVTLNADGTFTYHAGSDEEEVTFSYTIEDTATGVSDTGYVTVDTIPCFVAGTMIATVDGDRPVETLTEGDLILTHDNGLQPLRWIGRRTIAALDNMAPIHIAKGAFGNHDALSVSPQHRILVTASFAELWFGEPEVLVAAKDLVNGRDVTIQEGGEVEYVHLLFDRHEVIYSAGLATESFLPGPQTALSFDRAIIDEITTIFPEIDASTGEGYSPAARRILKGYEARILSIAKAA